MKSILSIVLLICLIDADPRIYTTRHFRIFYTERDDKNIREIADSLESNYSPIIADLKAPAPPIISVHLYADTPNYREGVRAWARNLPAWSTGITLGDSAIHLISPNGPGQNYQEMIRNMIHEYVHCVSREVNWTIVNNPRWLWEAVAIYESKQRSDPRQVPYLVNQKPPDLKALSSFSNEFVYEVGYFIAEYIVESKGKDALIALIKNNGNIQQSLQMDEQAFTREWFAFVKKKYGI